MSNYALIENESVCRNLENIADWLREKLAGGDLDKVILLCYEKPAAFCHRHLVADWINKHKGINFIVEYSKDVVPCREE